MWWVLLSVALANPLADLKQQWDEFARTPPKSEQEVAAQFERFTEIVQLAQAARGNADPGTTSASHILEGEAALLLAARIDALRPVCVFGEDEHELVNLVIDDRVDQLRTRGLRSLEAGQAVARQAGAWGIHNERAAVLLAKER